MSQAIYSRTTHTVRIKSSDGRFYADVEVLDAISVTLPSGYDICYKISTPNIVAPSITDLTGDNNGKPGDKQSTRASHMVRVTSTTNTQMFLDVEVCDAFTITGPNEADFCIQCPTPGKSVPSIIDNTGSGLTVGATKFSTRAQHVQKLTRQVGGQQAASDYTLILLTDAITYEGPEQSQGMPWIVNLDYGDISEYYDWQAGLWHKQHVLKFYNAAVVANGALSPSATTNDTTVYVTDPNTGLTVPPPNTDPNVYVYFPDGTEYPGAVATGCPFLGASPYTADGVPNPGGTGPQSLSIPAIDMGPIWWIRQLGSTDNVWFWFLSPVQQPLAFSFFGDPPEGANPKWAYRGFTLLPSFPVAWLLSVNYPIEPMGTYGAPDITTAASGYIDNGTLTVNWFGVGIPDGGWGVNTAIADEGALLEAGTAGYLAPIQYQGTSYYMPYGALDLTAPTSAEILAAIEATGGNTSVYTDYGGPMPNIYELTGIPQPPLMKPGQVWNATTNPHQQPSLAVAKQVAQTFAENWNLVANGINDTVSTMTQAQISSDWPNALVPPPGWNWERPYGGDTVATAQQFSNGWVPAVLAVETVPVTVPTIEVGQLDPSVWNLDPVVNKGNPPVLWATGQP